MKLRILICDDHDLMRRGVKTLLETQADWTVCAESRDGREAVYFASKLRPDVAILDVGMPILNGIDAAKRIRQESWVPKIIVLSAHCSVELVRQAIQAGALGYVIKQASGGDLVNAVRMVATGKPFFSPEAQAAFIEATNFQTEPREPDLSTREREIMQLLAEGKSSKEVGVELNLSVKTVDTHRSNIMRKLNVRNASELTLAAIRKNIIEA